MDKQELIRRMDIFVGRLETYKEKTVTETSIIQTWKALREVIV